jgi:hypothetical protein
VLEHPKLGASWEGFAFEQLLTMLESRDQDGVRLESFLPDNQDTQFYDHLLWDEGIPP